MSLQEEMRAIASNAKAAARQMTRLTTQEKNACLISMATALEANAEAIKAANEKDMATGQSMNLSSAMQDRLQLDDPRIAAMAKGLHEVAEFETPGTTCWMNALARGLHLRKVSAPSA